MRNVLDVKVTQSADGFTMEGEHIAVKSYLKRVQANADRISDRFIIAFFIIGLCLAPVYQTWTFTLVTTSSTVLLYLIARFVLTNDYHARIVISVVYSIFMLQFIGQMHGMAEMHFFFFTNIALLVIYQDWRLVVPYTVFALGHHGLLAFLQFYYNLPELSKYFISYGGLSWDGTYTETVTLFQLFFHFGLAVLMAIICGLWAGLLRRNSIELLEERIAAEKRNEKLEQSEKMLFKQTKNLEGTNNFLRTVRQELEDKQEMLKNAEKIAKMGSFNLVLENGTVNPSDNLPHIYGLEQIESGSDLDRYIHPEDLEHVGQAFQAAEQEPHKEHKVNYRLCPKGEEEYRYFEARIRTRLDPTGKPERLQGIARDITEEVKRRQRLNDAYQEIQASEEELRQNLEELEATQEQLKKQKDEAEKALYELQSTQKQLVQAEKMASLGQLVANIAHEINTPLGAIRSSTENMANVLMEALPALPEFIQKLDKEQFDTFYQFLRSASAQRPTLTSREKRSKKYDLMDKLEERGVRQADDIADLIVDMGMQDEDEQYTKLLQMPDPPTIFRMAYQLSGILRSNKTVRDATERASKIVFALKNFARQSQSGETSEVLLNESIETTLTLYHNKLKHDIEVVRDMSEIPAFPGYPDELVQVWTNIIHNAIQAIEGEGKLHIRTSIQGDRAQVRIQDNGRGIPREIQDRIFDPFFTTKGKGEGSGLGLDITQKIIAKHNGKIWFESVEDEGTTFFVELPLDLNAEEAKAAQNGVATQN